MQFLDKCFNRLKKKSNRGQVWIETVTYTMIAFVLIGLVIGFAKPKIEEIQDRAVIDESVQIIQQIDYIIQDVIEKGVGNKRRIDISIRKGEFNINGVNNSIEFRIEGQHMYSQPGEVINDGGLDVYTGELAKGYSVSIAKKYENFDIKYSGKDEIKRILKGASPYHIYITNKGGVNNTIDFEIN